MKSAFLFAAALLAANLPAADIELTETLQLPKCHSIGWVRTNTQVKGRNYWSDVLDEENWKLSDEQWRQAVKEKGEGKKEDVKFDLWIPEGVAVAKGIVVMSGYGSGESLYKHAELRKIARELHLAFFKFDGNPMQRGFWPRSLLYERLKTFGERAQHAELENVPLFLYGHSEGTGFSAIFAADSTRVWGWVSMRPSTTCQVYQPRAAKIPGLVIFGEEDRCFDGRSDGFIDPPSKEENMGVVEAMRKKHNALWNYAVEPKTGHGPGDKTWPLVFSFLRHTFAARVPVDADPLRGPVKLQPLKLENGFLGKNWDPVAGGYQTLPIAPFANFTGDKTTASWLINADYAADWQMCQRDGKITRP